MAAVSQISSSILKLLQMLIFMASLAPLLSTASSVASTSSSCFLSTNSSNKLPPSIKYYVHALNSGSKNVVPPVRKASPDLFGQAAVFAYTIREGAGVSSKPLGTIRGFEIYNSMDKNSTTILLLNTLAYNDGVYTGSISLHGQGDRSKNDYELAIVGGTGSFRAVGGYAAIRNLRTPGNDHVFEHSVHFFSASCPSTSVQ